MINRFLHNFFLIFLLSETCYAGPGDQVFIQLIPDNNFHTVVHKEVSDALYERDHRPMSLKGVSYPHISVIDVSDSNILKMNYPLFVAKISAIFDKYKSNLEYFVGNDLTPYYNEQIKATKWCLGDDNNNVDLIDTCKIIKNAIEEFIRTDKKYTENSPSSVNFSKGFPHISVVREDNCPIEEFYGMDIEPIKVSLRGFKIIYRFDTEDYKSDQIYVSKDFGPTDPYILQYNSSNGRSIRKSSRSLDSLGLHLAFNPTGNEYEKKCNKSTPEDEYYLSFKEYSTDSFRTSLQETTKVNNRPSKIKNKHATQNIEKSPKETTIQKKRDTTKKRPLASQKIDKGQESVKRRKLIPYHKPSKEQDEKQAFNERGQETMLTSDPDATYSQEERFGPATPEWSGPRFGPATPDAAYLEYNNPMEQTNSEEPEYNEFSAFFNFYYPPE